MIFAKSCAIDNFIIHKILRMSIVNCAKFSGVITMGLYERIKDLAKERGYSINRLEKELGFARSSINKFNTNKPSIDKIQQIADLLNISVDMITGEEKENETYYLNEETAKMAQAIFENKELRVLFDTAKDSTPEDLQTVHSMLLALKRKERGDID